MSHGSDSGILVGGKVRAEEQGGDPQRRAGGPQTVIVLFFPTSVMGIHFILCPFLLHTFGVYLLYFAHILF